MNERVILKTCCYSYGHQESEPEVMNLKRKLFRIAFNRVFLRIVPICINCSKIVIIKSANIKEQQQLTSLKAANAVSSSSSPYKSGIALASTSKKLTT